MAVLRVLRGSSNALVYLATAVLAVMIITSSIALFSSGNARGSFLEVFGAGTVHPEAGQMRDCYRGLSVAYHEQKPRDVSPEGQAFRRRAWRLLAAVVHALDRLELPHWLGSGSLLGFMRQCDIDPAMGDVDVEVAVEAMWQRNISVQQLVDAVAAEGPRLRYRFGRPQDSLELAFMDEKGTKIDMFFSYPVGNGTRFTNGMDSTTLEKYRWPYPQFQLCWSLLDGLRVGIPCDPSEYLRLAYGPDWASPPQTTWNYRTGRFVIIHEGYWPEEMRSEVFQSFEV